MAVRVHATHVPFSFFAQRYHRRHSSSIIISIITTNHSHNHNHLKPPRKLVLYLPLLPRFRPIILLHPLHRFFHPVPATPLVLFALILPHVKLHQHHVDRASTSHPECTIHESHLQSPQRPSRERLLYADRRSRSVLKILLSLTCSAKSSSLSSDYFSTDTPASQPQQRITKTTFLLSPTSSLLVFFTLACCGKNLDLFAIARESFLPPPHATATLITKSFRLTFAESQ